MTGGIITALEVQKRNPKRVNVYLDDVFAFSLTLDEAARLYRGQTLTADEIAALKQKDEIQRAVDSALRFLAPRPRSIHEMRRKLIEKGFAPETIASALDYLTRLGYLDDAAFANFWVRERQTSSPLSPRALHYELRRKGVSSEVIEAALAELDAAGAALRAAEMHARRLRGLTRREFHARLVAHLQRRGFSHSQAHRAIQTLIERTEPDFAPEPDTASSRRAGSGLTRSEPIRRARTDGSDDETGDYGIDES